MAKNEYLVTTPLQTSFKASIWLAMQEKNINQTQLAKTLNVDEKEIRRILDPSHNNKLETLERLRPKGSLKGTPSDNRFAYS